ncbi:MAG TPA: hypothetical protein VFI18_09870 [Gaiellales bacterium]|nr:hypothetical protein [Gaiellales bacterium]
MLRPRTAQRRVPLTGPEPTHAQWATLLAIVSVLGIAALASLRHPTLKEEPC